MNSRDISSLNNWVENYIDDFIADDKVIQENVDLKRNHTYRVREAILDIGASLGLTTDDLYIAEACALLHDIGRFEQYRRYRTFSDSRSENHAALGVGIIRENRILDKIDSVTSDIILKAVGCHNMATVPSSGDGHRWILFLRLVRDADKIDIWHIVTDYYRNPDNYRGDAVGLDLPDIDVVSDSVYNSLKKGGLANMADLCSLNDFKLLQIGWIYDLNFPRSFQIVKERDYIGMIRDTLPESSDRVDEIYKKAEKYMEKNLPGI